MGRGRVGRSSDWDEGQRLGVFEVCRGSRRESGGGRGSEAEEPY